jgi:phage shock protein A
MQALFRRITTILSANMNDLIDRVEDPERMIKQMIREMEQHIQQAKEGVIDAIASEKQLEKELQHHRDQAQEWLGKAETALKAQNEDLARMALARKNDHDDIVQSLTRPWEAARKTSENLKAQLHALEHKLEEVRHKRGTLVARQRAAEARQHMHRTEAAFRAGLDTQTTFVRMEDRVAEMEARTDAIAEVELDASPVERELREMELQADVEQELKALKQRLAQEQDS